MVDDKIYPCHLFGVGMVPCLLGLVHATLLLKCYVLTYEVRNWLEVNTTLLCMSTTIEQDPKVGEIFHQYIVHGIYLKVSSNQTDMNIVSCRSKHE